MQRNANQLKFVKSVGILHFIGIGGIGMSGIVEILHNLGYQVQGSDLVENDNIKRIRDLGINVHIGHNALNIKNVAVVVKSSAIKDDNPEIFAAREKRIPVIKRSEMLAEIMCLKTSVAVSGSHGKTTTTSLVACLFESANLNPTVINGGIINKFGTNAYLGSGDYLVAEADESDETFIKISATIGVVTNIDPEHLDFYGSFDRLKAAYLAFFENLPFYGFGVACIDHPEVRNLVKKITDKEVITYGIESSDADIRAVNIRQIADKFTFDVKISPRLAKNYSEIKDVILPMAGIHNVLNSLSAIAIGVKLEFKMEVIVSGFASFEGVKRRFTKVAEVSGVTIIDDYAHHPEEIKATLKTARTIIKKDSSNKIITIMQPHRYSRLDNLFLDFSKCFADTDIAYIAEIYSAGEEPIKGITSSALVEALNTNNPSIDAKLLNSPDDIAKIVKEHAKPGDMVIFLGAGSITKWAYDLPSQLEKLNVKIFS